MRNNISEMSRSLPKTELADEPWWALHPEPVFIATVIPKKKREHSQVVKHQCHTEDRKQEKNIYLGFSYLQKIKDIYL